jgi:crotonobetaine/carnitine-CoA ligase
MTPEVRFDPRRILLETPVADQNIPALLERRAAEFADKPLFKLGQIERTYRDLRDAAAATAGALRSAGVCEGDRVAAMCGNRIELFDLFLGCAWLGAVMVPLNPALRGGPLHHALANSGATALLIEPMLVEVLAHVEPLPELEVLWVLDGRADAVPTRYRIAEPPVAEEALPKRDIPPGELTAILYTSGTTGPAKGVMCPAAQFFWFAGTMCQGIRMHTGDVLYNCLPLYHINALLAPIQALFVGATCVIGERFSASRFWENAAKADATIIYLLGALPNLLLAQPCRPTDRAHRVKVMFAPGTATSVWEPFMERFGVEEIIEGYGSTETNHCLGRTPGHPDSTPGRMGWVFDEYFEAMVADEHDVELPTGTPGELLLRNRHPFSFATGYWSMPETTADAFRNLWFHTGDQVVRGEDGSFSFVDRLKDSMRRLGENISAWEVEQAIMSHPDVAEAAVFPVPSEQTDEEVMAAIILRGGRPLDHIALMQFLEIRLAHFAIPRYVDIVDALPHTPNGKVQKTALRARGVTPTTWDREAAGYTIQRLTSRRPESPRKIGGTA